MKTFFKLIFPVIFTFSSMFAQIYEIHEMEEIVPHVNTSTMLFFDLDDTLIHTTTALGSVRWDHYLGTALKGEFKQMHVPLLWYTMRNIPFVVMDEAVPGLIHDFQKNGISVMGLTARSPIGISIDAPEINLTTVTLINSGIKLGDNVYADLFSKEPSYDDGVIYCGGKSKGLSLKGLFESVGYAPEKVIFVDDKLSHVESVHNAMADAGIDCDCFWYRKIDQLRPSMDPIVALIQFEIILRDNVLLSDAEAEALKHAYLEVNPADHLMHLIHTYNPI